MKVEKIKDNVWKVESTKTYYISSLECPSCYDMIYICNCPDFLMGRPKLGINPMKFPCKHITFLLSHEDKLSATGSIQA